MDAGRGAHLVADVRGRGPIANPLSGSSPVIALTRYFFDAASGNFANVTVPSLRPMAISFESGEIENVVGVTFPLGSGFSLIVRSSNMRMLRKRTRERRSGKTIGQSLEAARKAGRYMPFGPYLGIGIGVVLLAWKNVVEQFFSYY